MLPTHLHLADLYVRCRENARQNKSRHRELRVNKVRWELTARARRAWRQQRRPEVLAAFHSSGILMQPTKFFPFNIVKMLLRLDEYPQNHTCSALSCSICDYWRKDRSASNLDPNSDVLGFFVRPWLLLTFLSLARIPLTANWDQGLERSNKTTFILLVTEQLAAAFSTVCAKPLRFAVV